MLCGSNYGRLCLLSQCIGLGNECVTVKCTLCAKCKLCEIRRTIDGDFVGLSETCMLYCASSRGKPTPSSTVDTTTCLYKQPLLLHATIINTFLQCLIFFLTLPSVTDTLHTCSLGTVRRLRHQWSPTPRNEKYLSWAVSTNSSLPMMCVV